MGILREWLVQEHLEERRRLQHWLEQDQQRVVSAHTRLEDYKFCGLDNDEMLWAEFMYNEAVRAYAETERDLKEWERRYGHLV